ncbi:MAG: cobalamin-dependent protein [Candidatus Eremiobacterota bacterium]
MVENFSCREDFKSALILMDRLACEKIIDEHMKFYSSPDIAEHLITPVMEELGSDWEKGNISLSQIYMTSRICEYLIDRILPPENPERKNDPRIAITILEDYHILGKRIVSSMLRAGGFNLYDYGTTSVDDLLHLVQKDNIEIVLISTLMLSSALKVKDFSEKLKAKKGEVKIFVGGAPFRFDRLLWKEVGASGMGVTASDAISLINTGGAL